MRATHTLASGILLPQNFKDSVRFALFQTGVDGWPYASHSGTVFLVSYRGRVLALTCAHVIGDFDWRGLSITDKKFGRRLALPTCLYYPSDLRSHAAGAAATDVTLRKAKAVFDNPALARITGCRGAAVFNATTERLCGMATRGSVNKGICTLWYLDIADIMAALTAVVEGRAEARYEKTVRRRVS